MCMSVHVWCVCLCVLQRQRREGSLEAGGGDSQAIPSSASSGAHSLWHGPGSMGSCLEASLPSLAWLWAAGWHGAGPSAAAVGRSWTWSGAGSAGWVGAGASEGQRELDASTQGCSPAFFLVGREGQGLGARLGRRAR